jgi:Putative quorum-sensing-regulated virulence factor
MPAIKMTFGKHKGKRLAKVPTDYLVWCLDAVGTLDADLRAAIEQELAKREETPPEVKSGLKAVSPVGQTLAGDVRMLFRNLALKYHPDRGGSDAAMQALNEFHEELQELIRRTFTVA